MSKADDTTQAATDVDGGDDTAADVDEGDDTEARAPSRGDDGVTGTFPLTVDCATCGGTARQAAWGATDAVCYKCGDCHAGGHIDSHGGQTVRRGGVFRQLSNLATRHQAEVSGFE